jgi:hypothetical protein
VVTIINAQSSAICAIRFETIGLFTTDCKKDKENGKRYTFLSTLKGQSVKL